VQEKGRWLLMWLGGSTLGSPLPRGAMMLAVAGDDKSLWALGRGEVGPLVPVATAPATAQSTAPATARPARSSLSAAVTRPIATALYEWDVKQWVPRAILSDEFLIGEPSAVSMAIVSARPMLSANDRDGMLRIIRLESNGAWQELGRIARQRAFKLLSTPARPLLWTSAGGAAGSIVPIDQLASAKPIVLPAPPDISESDPRAIASATGLLRLVYMHDKKLLEQAYSTSGELRGQPTPLVSVAAPRIDTWQHWLALTMLVLLTLFVFGPARRRSENLKATRGGSDGGATATLDPDVANAVTAGGVQEKIAPPRLRLQAGVLDALPLILVSFFIVSKSQEEGATTTEFYDRATYMSQIWLWIAAYAVYFLHTLLSELFSGRTLGKWIFGLRVTKLDGTRPTALQFLIRNFVRVLEFHLLLPLIVIIFSPLKQRIGDMAAGTVVLADEVPAREEDEG
jgi:uncharacterized RDD family membrane protein YckC